MANVFDFIPSATGMEMMALQDIMKDMTNENAARFASMYNTQRRDYTIMLVLCLLGFFGISGIHRFAMNDIGMGILYFLTGGLCLIGTIVDLVNMRNMVDNYNVKQAREIIFRMNSGRMF